jgi:hypothetical protein
MLLAVLAALVAVVVETLLMLVLEQAHQVKVLLAVLVQTQQVRVVEVEVLVLLVLHLLLTKREVVLALAQFLVFQEKQFNTLVAVVEEVGMEALTSL